MDLFKVVLGGDAKKLSKLFSKLIAAMVIFFVPTMVYAILDTIMPDSETYNNSCWANATSDNIHNLEYARLIAEKQRLEQEDEDGGSDYPIPPVGPDDPFDDPGGDPTSEIPVSSSLTPFVNGVQRALNPGDCMSASDKCACPSKGRFNGFYFVMASETGREMKSVTETGGTKMVSATVTCSDGSVISKTVNQKVLENYKKAFEKICLLKTTGINGIKLSDDNLMLDGTLVRRTTSSRKICSFHAYGSAMDINYNLEITVNGTKYKPYKSQGTDTKKEYDRFVAALGREDDVRNVNYILWKYAFEPYNFTWGGNWSEKSFDPMHFEVSK